MVTPHATWLKRLPPTLYKLGAQAWIDYEFPRHLFLETTAACNLACPYCPRERRVESMAFETLQGVVDEATHYGPRSFSLHLFGEPLLYKRCWDAVQYIKQAHPKHTVLLTTNGTLLERQLDALLSSQVDVVLWTWRPEASFTPETRRRLRAWGKFRVRFIEEVTPKEAYAEWADWPNQESRNLHSYGGTIDITKFGVQDAEQATGSSRHPCYHLWLAPAVAWNGNLLLCCADPHQQEVLGTFPQMSVHQAWTSDRMNAIRQGHLQGEYKGICAGCDVWKQYPDLFFGWQKR